MLEIFKENYKQYLMTKYFDIATNIYKWENVPKEIPIRYPERWLYENGLCVFFNVTEFVWLLLGVLSYRVKYTPE